VTVPAGRPPDPAPVPCALCGAPTPAAADRCPACGFARPRAFSRAAIAALCALLVAVYAVTLLAVALAR
jgi:hypothetical protein